MVRHYPDPALGRTAGESPNPWQHFKYDSLTPSIGSAMPGTGTESPSFAGPIWFVRTVDGAKDGRRQHSVRSEFVGGSLDSFNKIDAVNGLFVAGEPLRLCRTHDAGTHWAWISRAKMTRCYCLGSIQLHVWSGAGIDDCWWPPLDVT